MSEDKKKTILVVDDEETILEMVKLKLQRSGFDVYCAKDGIEALEVIERIIPDLIVLDIIMPRMDGFQFLKKIREDKETAEVPVLVLTARGAMKDTFEELSVRCFLVKPFEPEELLRQVNKILSGSADKNVELKRALVAASEKQRLAEMCEQLEEKGYRVSIATSGPEALGKALQILPELFIVQFDMPDMNADEIIKVLDSHPGAENISVMIYSALQDDNEIEQSPWGHFLKSDQEKTLRNTDGPLKIVRKFDSSTFLDKLRDLI